MSTESMMKRGAREANEESDRLRASRAMGEALGSLAAFITAINKLTERVEQLEGRVQQLESP